MALEEYRKKRDFRQTPEPRGKPAKQRQAKGLAFVIQKHAASRLHYDFRLELDGVLKSWAVPKGPSLDPGEKRLAVHVEDHPVDYGDFEGIIPRGQYGGGTVLLWDRGTWEPIASDAAPDAEAAYRKGHIKFQLHGGKLAGGWNLVRISGRRRGDDGDDNWLLIKERDDAARPGSGDAIVVERPESIASGRSLEEIAADPERVWESNRASEPPKPARTPKQAKSAEPAPSPAGVPGARRAPLPKSGLEPQLATLVDRPPKGDGWFYEIKYDGYRALLSIDGKSVHLTTRRGNDWTARFRPIAEAAKDLPAEKALLDGEIVVLLPDGTTSFQALQNALADERTGDLVYFAFDLLHLDGYDLRRSPLAARKEALASLLAGIETGGGTIRYGEHVLGQGDGFFRQACAFGLEGVIAKRADSFYRSGRSQDWLKVKCLKRQELVIVGYTDPEGSRTGFGALLLAVHGGSGDAGELTFAGKVGTGFDQASLVDLHRRLTKLARKTPAFANPPRGAEARRSHWVDPKLVAEVSFTEWTQDGVLRHPSFQGLREDKDPQEIVRERPQPVAAVSAATSTKTVRTSTSKKAPAVKTAPVPKPAPGKKGQGETIGGVRLTHPERVLYPSVGLTKRDLALYYERVADWILPHLADRPLTLVRCPEGQGKECFYQKHLSHQFPPSIARVDVGEAQPYGALHDLAGLIALVQMGVLEIHLWGSHVDRLEQPDYIVFDLDPDEGLPWERVVEGARAVKARLEDLGLSTFLKSTGGKGLHVVSPLAPRLPWDDVKAFTKGVVEAIAAEQPKLYTPMLPKARRQGRIFIDYLRNGRGATSIAAYSTRARPGAPVSTPLFWEELDDPELRGNTYTVETLPARLDALKADPWKGFAKAAKAITAKMLKAVGAS